MGASTSRTGALEEALKELFTPEEASALLRLLSPKAPPSQDPYPRLAAFLPALTPAKAKALAQAWSRSRSLEASRGLAKLLALLLAERPGRGRELAFRLVAAAGVWEVFGEGEGELASLLTEAFRSL